MTDPGEHLGALIYYARDRRHAAATAGLGALIQDALSVSG